MQHKLIKVEKDGNDWKSTFEVHDYDKIGDKKDIVTLTSKALILATPAFVTAKILGSKDGCVPEASSLQQIEYPPIASVTLAYPNDALKNSETLKGGYLIPRAMNMRTLGTICYSSLFPENVPPGYSTFQSYIGGALDQDIVNIDKAFIVQEVNNDIKKILLRKDAMSIEPKVLGVKVWSKAIPQYNIGHLDLLAKVDEALRLRHAGLYVGGNYRSGVTLVDSVKYGENVAKQVSVFLSVKDVTDSVLSGRRNSDENDVPRRKIRGNSP